MSTDDFLASAQSTPKSKVAEESVEDKVSQSEVDSVLPLQAQGEAIMKRQRLNAQAQAKQFIMRERNFRPLYRRPCIFVEDVQYPLVSMSTILPAQIKSQTPPSKKLTNFEGLLRSYLTAPVKVEHTQRHIQLIIVALEKRNGLCSLIAREPKSPKLVRVLLCPIFSHRLKLTPGSEITLKRYQSFNISSDDAFQTSLQQEFKIKAIHKVLIAEDYHSESMIEKEKEEPLPEVKASPGKAFKASKFASTPAPPDAGKRKKQASGFKKKVCDKSKDTADEEDPSPPKKTKAAKKVVEEDAEMAEEEAD